MAVERLNDMNTTGVTLLNRCLTELKLECVCCKSSELIKEIENYVLDWTKERCSVCQEVILKDLSYIQNCNGIQHLGCYWDKGD